MHPVLNDMRWVELRRAMACFPPHPPRWRTRDTSGYQSGRDGDWFYHLREGRYATNPQLSMM